MNYSQQVLTGQGLPLSQHDAQSEQVADAVAEFPPARASEPSEAAAKIAAVICRNFVFMCLFCLSRSSQIRLALSSNTPGDCETLL